MSRVDAAWEARWDEILADAAGRAAARERARELPEDTVRALQGLGFGALRVGEDAEPFRDVVRRLVDLAAADSNVAHLYRGHVAFAEELRWRAGEPGVARWARRLEDGGLVGNAQSERRETAVLGTVLERGSDGAVVSGTKYYTTGSIYADWIRLSALEDGDRVHVTVDAAHAGVTSVDDWDGFGQPLTGSGTTTFARVPVDDDDIERPGESRRRSRLQAAVFQLVLVAVTAGIAAAARDETVEAVRVRRRTFGVAGESSPREDPLVQALVGGLSATAGAARAIVLGAAETVGRALDLEAAGADDEEAALAALVAAYEAQQVVPPAVLRATTELFEVGGASLVGRGRGLDRHWRNARTVASHNPALQRARQLGDLLLNGREPGWAPAAAATAAAVDGAGSGPPGPGAAEPAGAAS